MPYETQPLHELHEAGSCSGCGGCPSCCSCQRGAAVGEIAHERGGRRGRLPTFRRLRRRRRFPWPVPARAGAMASAVSAPEPPEPPPAATPSGFTPTPVENPGGGRIRDKTAPRPDQLVTVKGVGGRNIPLHRLAAQAWQALVAAARHDGIAAPLMLPVSGFRDPALQERLWNAAKARYGSPQEARKWVAPPGGSPHQTGRAIDFYIGGRNASGNVPHLRTLPAYHWLVANAVRFGFYPYTAEPWHWEYNPPAGGVAREMAVQSEFDMQVGPEIPYDVDPNQPFGPRWKRQPPPGLPSYARLTSRAGAASPYITQLATATGLGPVFVRTLVHLAETESGGMFGRPANIFDTRPDGQRPTGKPFISAWGAFQFNRGAWRGLPGVPNTAFPWDCTALEEIVRPIAKYTQLYRAVTTAGGSALDGARGIRLWHRTPVGFNRYLANGRRTGFAAAWRAIPENHRGPVDAHLAQARLPLT